MPEAWEITSNDNRIANKITTFIIFCEDENDEPYYFRSFEIENKIKINCIPNQKKAKLNLINTLIYCKNAGLVESIDHTFKIKEGTEENIWCVYDRDLEHSDLSIIKESDEVNFTTSINTAIQSGLKVAWSNDSFELWVLLHFELVPTKFRLHRDYIYERLSEILKSYPEIEKKFNILIDAKTFKYKIHLKKRLAFLNFILPILKQKTEVAIKNAEILEAAFENGVPYHDCNPCTKIHYLVRDLLQNA